MEKYQRITKLLNEIGFTDLEAKIYLWLLKNSESTGYRIAKNINKPVANTYKALNNLEEKGAIVCDRSKQNNTYNTIPINHFLTKLENEFSKQREQIESEISKLEQKEIAGGIYKLNSSELVYQKAIDLINSTKDILLIDSFPKPLMKLKKHIEERKNTKAKVYLKNYANEKIKNAVQIKAINAEKVIQSLNGQWLIMVKDTKETLLAYFNSPKDELINSAWINDPFISFIMFNGSANEFNLIDIFSIIYGKHKNKEQKIKEVISSYQDVYDLMTKNQNTFVEKK